MLIIGPSGVLLWLFSVFCSGSRLFDWFMQCIFTENFLDVFVWERGSRLAQKISGRISMCKGVWK